MNTFWTLGPQLLKYIYLYLTTNIFFLTSTKQIEWYIKNIRKGLNLLYVGLKWLKEIVKICLYELYTVYYYETEFKGLSNNTKNFKFHRNHVQLIVKYMQPLLIVPLTKKMFKLLIKFNYIRIIEHESLAKISSYINKWF